MKAIKGYCLVCVDQQIKDKETGKYSTLYKAAFEDEDKTDVFVAYSNTEYIPDSPYYFVKDDNGKYKKLDIEL